MDVKVLGNIGVTKHMAYLSAWKPGVCGILTLGSKDHRLACAATTLLPK